LADEVLELPDEMCLIGQATGVGDLRPRPAVPSFCEDLLKPRQARKSLRADAKSSIEDTRKMTRTGAQFCSEAVHLHGRVLPEIQRRTVGEVIGMGTKMSKQEGMDTSNPLFACPRRCEHVVTHCHFGWAEQISKVEIGVCELPKRSLDDAARRVGSKTNNDDAKRPGGAQSNGMRLNLGRALRRQERRALMYFRRLSILTDQLKRGARRALDCKRPGEIPIRNVAIPDCLEGIGKQR